jgi:hypothetical protein
MMAPLTITTISLEGFNEILSRYASLAPTKLTNLDAARYDAIPAALAARKESGDVYLQKEEVEQLVEWKLYATPVRKLL